MTHQRRARPSYVSYAGTRVLAMAVVLPVVVAVALLTVACAPVGDRGAGGAAPLSLSGPMPSPAPVQLRLPEHVPWQAGPGETQPDLKTTATRLVEGAATWSEVGGGQVQAVSARAAGVASPGAEASLGQALTGVADATARAAVLQVDYPQLGGITESAASVMVSAQQSLITRSGEGEQVSARHLTFDVRLARSGTGGNGDGGGDGPWRVTAVHGGLTPGLGDAPVQAPSDAAAAVLDRDNISLAGASGDDVRAGLVADEVLNVLLGVADQHAVGVSVFSTGHPWEVFATDRQSNHSRGRAVDVYSLDGLRIDDPQLPRSTVEAFMRAAGAAGATEVGGPIDPNDAARGYFSDALHADHVHIGLTPGKAPLG